MVYLFERITVSVCFAFHGHICHRNLLLDQDHNYFITLLLDIVWIY